MPYGLEVRNGSSNVIFSSINAQGGVCGAAVEVAQGTSQTFNFTLYPGRTARVVAAFTGGTFSSISYASGYPSVTVACPSGFVDPMTFLIFIY